MRHYRTLLFLLFIWPILSFAETIELAGVTFPIQEYKKVDDTTVKISVLGNPRIVKQENAHDEIVKQFFSSWDKTKQLGIESISNFCIQSLSSKKLIWCLTAFDALALTFADYPQETIQSLENILENTNEDLDFLRTLIKNGNFKQYRPELKAALIFLVSTLDIAWVKKELLPDANSHKSQINKYAIRQILFAINNNEIELAGKKSSTLESLFPQQDSQAKTISSLVNTYAQISDSYKESPYAARKMINQQSIDPAFTAEINNGITRLSQIYAERYLNDSKSKLALEYLSLASLNYRTPKTHQLAAEILDFFHKEPQTTHSFEVHLFLEEISKYDSELKNKYLEYLEYNFYQYLEHNEPQKSETQLELIRKIRPDPDKANDQLRVALVLLYLDQGLKIAANDKLKEIQTEVSFITRLKLVFAGLYIPLPMLIFILALPLLGTLGYLIRTNNRQNRARDDMARATYEQIIEDVEKTKIKGFNPTPKTQIDPLQQEYQNLLLEFGLRGQVSLKQVKKAYRDMVKKSHPDIKPGEESEDFLRTMKNYEKLLELRKKLSID
ncbi:MAG: hypothetical protein KDD56_02830 [Bdellovibrionales bacterium]|nr:hypothetical protein [Bdellovibrionales bacterium]